MNIMMNKKRPTTIRKNDRRDNMFVEIFRPLKQNAHKHAINPT